MTKKNIVRACTPRAHPKRNTHRNDFAVGNQTSADSAHKISTHEYLRRRLEIAAEIPSQEAA